MHLLRQRLQLAPGILMLILGCSGASHLTHSAPATLQVLTDSASYTLSGPGLRASALVRVINGTPDTVLLAPCGGQAATAVERLYGSEWGRVDRGICPAVLTEPVSIAPGGTEIVHVHLGGGPGMLPSAMIGTLRIVVRASALRRDAQGRWVQVELPLAERVTAPFTVRR